MDKTSKLEQKLGEGQCPFARDYGEIYDVKMALCKNNDTENGKNCNTLLMQDCKATYYQRRMVMSCGTEYSLRPVIKITPKILEP